MITFGLFGCKQIFMEGRLAHLNTDKPSISAVIITKNERTNIEQCIKALEFTDEVCLVDSGSTDGTATLAARLGARVIVKPWLGFGPQKRFAVRASSHEWILSIDADERVSHELAMYIQKFISEATELEVLYISRQSFFLGKPIKFCGWNPDYVGRVFNRKATNFSTRLVHEALDPVTDKAYAPKKLKILHYSYPTEESIRQKIQLYGKLGAKELLKNGAKPKKLAVIRAKAIFAFIRTYIFRLGILDGIAGIRVSLMNAKTTYFKYTLHRFLEEKQK